MTKFKSTQGFTLVELLLVMAVMGVIASVVLVSINPLGQFQKARDAQRKSDLRQIQSALEMYRSDQGAYPLTAGFPACNTAFAAGGITYMQKVPCDPKGSTGYTYDDQASNGRTYILKACLENASDPQKDNPLVQCTPVGGSSANGAILSVTNP